MQQICAMKFPVYRTNQTGILDIFVGQISWPNHLPTARCVHQDGPGRQGVPDLAWHFLTSGTSMRG